MTASGQMKSRCVLWAICAAGLALMGTATGCRQKMADQPYYRPLEESEFFADKRGSRPLERGVIHRAQRLETDPMVTGLTAAEWKRSYEYGVPIANVDAPIMKDADRLARSVGTPRYAPTDAIKVYADEYPFQITSADLKRGQERYTIFCAVCHGPLGNGMGKVRERGYLTPTSFHTKTVSDSEEQELSRVRDGESVADDASKKKHAERVKAERNALGLSRGYKLWGHRVPMDEAPVGYYFEVITKGYGGMPSYSAQIPAADRWRIIAYIRALQLSQNAAAGGKK